MLRLVPDEPLELRVYPADFVGGGDPVATRRGVRPSPRERELRLGLAREPGALEGRALLADGRVPAGAVAYAVLEGFAELDATPAGARFGEAGLRQSSVDAEGRFRFDVLEPGQYRLFVGLGGAAAAGLVDGGECTVLAGERLDVGTLRAPPTTPVRFRPEPAAAGAPAPTLRLGARLGPCGQPLLRRELAGAFDLPLLPGRYVLQGDDGTVLRELVVEPGAHLEVPVRCP